MCIGWINFNHSILISGSYNKPRITIFCPNYCILNFNIQTAVTFTGGKFVLNGIASSQEEKHWKRFLIPNAISDRLQFFDSLTKEFYDAAYTTKQSRFEA